MSAGDTAEMPVSVLLASVALAGAVGSGTVNGTRRCRPSARPTAGRPSARPARPGQRRRRVAGDDHLCGAVCAQSTHGSVFEPAVIVLDRVVNRGVLLDVALRLWGSASSTPTPEVNRRGGGDHVARDHRERPQRSGEEPSGRVGVSAGRDRHVDDLPGLIDGSVDVSPQGEGRSTASPPQPA